MTIPLGRLASINPPVPEFLDAPDDDVTFMPLECVWPDGKADETRRRQASDVARGYTQFRAGDILLPKITPTFEAGRAMVADINTPVGAGTTELHVLRARASVEPRFLAYVCRSQPFLQQGATCLQGVGNLRRVPSSFVARFPVTAISVDEQRAIADYLDRETTRINILIEEQQRLIDLLGERRRAVIALLAFDGVTPLSDSEDAPTTLVRYHFSVTLGKMLDSGKKQRNGDRLLPYIRAANIQDSGLSLDDIKKMPYSEAEADSLNIAEGDLLVVEGGAVGTTAIVDRSLNGWSFQKTVNRVRALDGWSTEWLGYVIRAFRDAGAIDIICNKSTIPHFTAEKLQSMRIPSLLPDDQRCIAARLDRETQRVDKLIAETERFIQLASERRTALITAAVTGQVDVRETEA